MAAELHARYQALAAFVARSRLQPSLHDVYQRTRMVPLARAFQKLLQLCALEHMSVVFLAGVHRPDAPCVAFDLLSGAAVAQDRDIEAIKDALVPRDRTCWIHPFGAAEHDAAHRAMDQERATYAFKVLARQKGAPQPAPPAEPAEPADMEIVGPVVDAPPAAIDADELIQQAGKRAADADADADGEHDDEAPAKRRKKSAGERLGTKSRVENVRYCISSIKKNLTEFAGLNPQDHFAVFHFFETTQHRPRSRHSHAPPLVLGARVPEQLQPLLARLRSKQVAPGDETPAWGKPALVTRQLDVLPSDPKFVWTLARVGTMLGQLRIDAELQTAEFRALSVQDGVLTKDPETGAITGSLSRMHQAIAARNLLYRDQQGSTICHSPRTSLVHALVVESSKLEASINRWCSSHYHRQGRAIFAALAVEMAPHP